MEFILTVILLTLFIHPALKVSHSLVFSNNSIKLPPGPLNILILSTLPWLIGFKSTPNVSPEEGGGRNLNDHEIVSVLRFWMEVQSQHHLH